MVDAENRIATMLYPLTQFIAAGQNPALSVDVIDGKQMPQPYQSLLVHDSDMTPTLEAYCKDTIHLQVMQVRFAPEAMYRQVLLMIDGENVPIEFGAIRIDLSLFEEKAKKQIVEGYTPLGTILHRYDITHYSRPNAFFKVEPDELIREAFRMNESEILFGRHNVIYNADGKSLAEVVEILPPLSAERSVESKANSERKSREEMASHGS